MPCGPPLCPICYVIAVGDISSLDGEVCNVRMEDLGNKSGRVVKIDTRGRLIHHDCLSQLINDVQHWPGQKMP
jgi:hypothetical protein